MIQILPPKSSCSTSRRGVRPQSTAIVKLVHMDCSMSRRRLGWARWSYFRAWANSGTTRISWTTSGKRRTDQESFSKTSFGRNFGPKIDFFGSI